MHTPAHYCPVPNGRVPARRIAACGTPCVAGTPASYEPDGTGRGTSRLVYVRCRRCVSLVRQYVSGK